MDDLASIVGVPIALPVVWLGLDMGGADGGAAVSVLVERSDAAVPAKPPLHRALTSPRSFALRRLRKRIARRTG